MSREEFAMEVERMKARLMELMTGKFGECRILTVKGKFFRFLSRNYLSFFQSSVVSSHTSSFALPVQCHPFKLLVFLLS